MTKRLHPSRAAAAAALLLTAATAQSPPTLTGIDVMELENFRRLAGAKVGLITNATGRNRFGERTADIMARNAEFQLVSLFSPEHGPQADAEGAVDSSVDAATGLPVHSLYGETREPTPAMLDGLDTMVFDIQDIGCRFYTYVSTMKLALRAAGASAMRFVVLDRPNPLGDVVDGPMLDSGRENFVGTHSLPIRHGMTAGELARMFNEEDELNADVRVVQVRNWTRGQTFDETGLPWVNPSPNMRSINQAFLYPGVGLLEFTNLSVGRGTDRPFEWIGAPWMDGYRLAQWLRGQPLRGVRVLPRRQTPVTSKFAGEECSGIEFAIHDRAAFDPFDLGLRLACSLRDLFPDAWEMEHYDRLLGDAATLDALRDGKTAEEIRALWTEELDAFKERRKPYLLYSQ